MNTVSRTTKALYYTSVGLFSTLFIVSILLSLFDPQGTIESYHHLSFPDWLLIPQTTAKFLGLIAIIQKRSQILKNFAFAGFLYDLLLALGAHIALRETDAVLAIVGLLLWVFTFTMDQIYYRQQAHTIALSS